MFKQATALVFIATVGWNGAARAQPAETQILGAPTCERPTLMNSMPMDKVPGSNLMTVTASINDSPQKMLFDIGRASSQLWNSTATKLHIAVEPGGSDWDFGGRYSENAARIGRLNLGSITSGGFYLQVSPDPSVASAPFDGLLRNDVMWMYDIDLDFAHQRLNYFSPEQCKGAGIYWAPSTITSVPIVAYAGTQYGNRSPIPRLGTAYVVAALEGRAIVALLDTSADRSFLNPDVAKNIFKLNAESFEPGEINDGGTLIKAGLHRFSSLTLGGLTASNFQIAIPIDIKTQSSQITHINRTARQYYDLHEILPDLVIGMDLLRHSHLYVSYKNDRVYVSAAGEGAALNVGEIRPSRLNVR